MAKTTKIRTTKQQKSVLKAFKQQLVQIKAEYAAEEKVMQAYIQSIFDGKGISPEGWILNEELELIKKDDEPLKN